MKKEETKIFQAPAFFSPSKELNASVLEGSGILYARLRLTMQYSLRLNVVTVFSSESFSTLSLHRQGLSNRKINLQSKFCFGMTVQTLNIALCL